VFGHTGIDCRLSARLRVMDLKGFGFGRAATAVQMQAALAAEVDRPAVSPETNGEFVTLARVVKTQGRHGEVAAETHSDVPDRFSVGMKLFALGKESVTRRELEVEELWPHKGLLVLKLAGVDSMSDAEELIGSELQLPRAERAVLEPGWTYVSDLIGCAVLDHSRKIGCLEDVQFGAGEAPLLIVKDETGKKFDVPFAEAYLEGVDAESREVRLNLPEGMLEINGPMTEEEKHHQQTERNRSERKREKR
jgi:16S rRNA processing protein RimM